MKIRIIITLALIFVFVSTLSAGDKTFKSFQLSYVTMDYIDVTATLYGISKGYKEANPIARLYIKSPPLTIAVHAALNFAIIKLSNIVYKRNKSLGLSIIIGLNLVKAYVIYRNIKTLTGG